MIGLVVPLSAATGERLQALFADAGPAAHILENECADNLPFYKSATPESLERIRFDELKLRKGTMDSLRRAINLAKIDRPDLLMHQTFGDTESPSTKSPSA